MFSAIITSQQTYTWFIVPLLQRLFGGNSGSTRYRIAGAWQIIKCIVYLILGLGVVCLTLVNPSLAIVFAVPLIPICILMKPRKSFMMLLLQSTILFLISPPVLLLMFGANGDILQQLLENYTTFGNLLLPWIIYFCWPIILCLQLLVTMEP